MTRESTDAFVSTGAAADDTAGEHTPTATRRSRKRQLAVGATVIVATLQTAAPAWAGPVMGC